LIISIITRRDLTTSSTASISCLCSISVCYATSLAVWHTRSTFFMLTWTTRRRCWSCCISVSFFYIMYPSDFIKNKILFCFICITWF
jgi:hypothetical protein